LYDDLNRTKDQLTIYDDWRTFEKKIEFAENYFNLKSAQDAAETKSSNIDSRFYYHFEHSDTIDPYEGEIVVPEESEDDISPDAIITPEKAKPATENDDKSSPGKNSLSSLAERERLLVKSAEKK